MAKIKQLKDKSGTEQIFPKTKTQAIYNTDGSLLSDTLDNLYGSLATIESSPTTTSHSVGEYIIYQGQVYKVTSVIASGDSLVEGTNISVVNLGSQIDTLNGQVSTLNSKTTPSENHSVLNNSLRWRTVGNVCQLTAVSLGLTADISNCGLPAPIVEYFLMSLIYSNTIVGFVEYSGGTWKINRIGSNTLGYGNGCFIVSTIEY